MRVVLYDSRGCFSDAFDLRMTPGTARLGGLTPGLMARLGGLLRIDQGVYACVGFVADRVLYRRRDDL